MRTYKDIIYEKKGHIAYITLNRPEKRNAMRLGPGGTYDGFLNACLEAERDEEVRVFVIKGAGPCFSSGHDLNDEVDAVPEEPLASHDFMQHMTNILFRALWDNPKPSIAQVHGECLAGTCWLVSYSDIVIASDDAVFGQPNIRFGSAAVDCIWPWLTGIRQSKLLFFTGNLMDAEEALRIGFVTRVVPRASLEEEVNILAEEIASIEPIVTRLNKLCINQWYEIMGLRTIMDYSATHRCLTYGASPKVLPGGLRHFAEISVEKRMKAFIERMNAPVFLKGDKVATARRKR